MNNKRSIAILSVIEKSDYVLGSPDMEQAIQHAIDTMQEIEDWKWVKPPCKPEIDKANAYIVTKSLDEIFPTGYMMFLTDKQFKALPEEKQQKLLLLNGNGVPKAMFPELFEIIKDSFATDGDNFILPNFEVKFVTEAEALKEGETNG